MQKSGRGHSKPTEVSVNIEGENSLVIKKKIKENNDVILPRGEFEREDQWEAKMKSPTSFPTPSWYREKIPGISDLWTYFSLMGFSIHVFQSSGSYKDFSRVQERAFEFQIKDTLEHCKPKWAMTSTDAFAVFFFFSFFGGVVQGEGEGEREA